MKLVEYTKTVPYAYAFGEGDGESFGRLETIQRWADYNDVPRFAELRYAGCGTHQIEFYWTVEEREPFDERDST